MSNFCTFFILLLASFAASATGIRGTVKTAKGEPLPYAAVAVKGSPNGTMSNAEGRYELLLPAGSYEIVVQYLGFKTTQKTVEVAKEWLTLDVVLEEQALKLSEVRVGSKSEDPAYTIMRRAIGKARFHELQVQSYTARAYIKGTGTPTKIPFFLSSELKKEGIEVGKAIFNESVNEITFTQPRNYKMRVLSTRNSLDNSAPSPNSYLVTSLYNPSPAGTVSPLSPRALGYYKFEYQGSFQENGVEINKIKVIPRSYGEGVYRGTIYIIENTWAIHSANLETTNQGFDFEIKQLYAPREDVWLPVNQQFKIAGSLMGFAGSFRYVVSVNYLSLKVNPAFKESSVTVLDEKFTPPPAKISKSDLRTKKLEELAEQQKEFSTKQLRQLVRAYEKQDLKERKNKKEDVNVLRSDSVTIDSLANKRGDDFWKDLRTVPLTEIETKSYRQFDSIRVAKELKIKTDSTKAKRDSSGHLSFSTFAFGQTFKLGKKTNLAFEGPLRPQNLAYNTVEGLTLQSALALNYNPSKNNNFYLKPLGRYSFARRVFSGTVAAGWSGLRRGLSLTGGRYVAQLNANNPISSELNTLSTLFFERNFMKIYEKQFAQLSFYYSRLADVLSLSANVEYAQRTELANTENARPFINWRQYSFTPNRPDNVGTANAGFDLHHALTFNVGLTWKPGQKYSLYNGQKRYSFNRNPALSVQYSKGIPNVGKSTADFDQLELGLNHTLELGIRNELRYAVVAGAFLNNRSTYFMDFKHFMGNEFFLQRGNILTSFRALPYYTRSTNQNYLEVHALNSMRRFLLTRFPLVRLSSIKENLMVHYLWTPSTPHYAEVGYGLDGLIPGFPFFRVEIVPTFLNWQYQSTVFRVGTTYRFGRR